MEHRTILALDGVGVRYKRPLSRKEFWALQNVSMTVQSGETIGVIGRNGAGKSTLLKVLSGIIEPDKGTVERAPGRVSLLSLQVGFLWSRSWNSPNWVSMQRSPYSPIRPA
jgi:lipopolysaccharide transport system ATP-binding protein